MKNKILLIFFGLCVLLLTSCSKDKPYVYLSLKNPAMGYEEKLAYSFPRNQKVYYIVYAPKGFKDDVIKIQIFKRDEKLETLGYSYFLNKPVKLNGKNHYGDYIVFSLPGVYVIQVFNISQLQKPVLTSTFKVEP